MKNQLFLGAVIGSILTLGVIYTQDVQPAWADVDDAGVTKFLNEDVRPLAEEMRALYYRIQDVQARWFAGHNVTIPNTTEVIIDGRAGQGVSVLTGADVHNLLYQASLLNETMMLGTITKPCVRSLTVD